MSTSNMVVQTNILALNSHRNMKKVGSMQARASERLSSGYRINTAADDAAGLAISEKMRAQIRGLDMASKNANDGISLIKTAEGGMRGVDDMLQRIRELVVMVSNDTNENNRLGTGDRQKVQDEINQLIMEIDDMSERVEFNKKRLINGSFQDTAHQLAISKATFDRTQLDVVAAQARYDALAETLNRDLDPLLAPAGTSEQSEWRVWNGTEPLPTSVASAIARGDMPAVGQPGGPIPNQTNMFFPGTLPNWQLSGARTLLNFHQNELDTAFVPQYRQDVEIFTRAEMIYQEQVKEYNDARTELMTALSDARLSGLTSLRAEHFNPDSQDFYLGPERAARVIAATQRYNRAALSLGIDEMGIQQMTATTQSQRAASAMGFQFRVPAQGMPNHGPGGPGWPSSPGSPAGPALTGTNPEPPGPVMGAASATAIGVIPLSTQANLRWTMDPAVGGVHTFQRAQRAFGTAQLEYSRAVSVRDAAQARLDSTQALLTQQMRELNAANVRNNAADISFRAARDLDSAGGSLALHFQVGPNANQSLLLSIGSLKSNTLGIGDGNGRSWINVVKDSGQDITATLDVLDQAMSYVTTQRSLLGAAQNRMEYTQTSLDITSENISDAQSRVRDADMANEMMNSTKANILQQVSVSMMAQANQAPQSILQLLRG